MSPVPGPVLPDDRSGHGPGHGGRLTIDLGALHSNYRRMTELAAPAECAAAVKADAYGLGLEPVSAALWQAGCRTFFVAHLSEAVRLRAAVGSEAVIYVLNGLLPGLAPRYAAIDARPVLCSPDDIAQWRKFCAGAPAPMAAIMIDTGFNRLGLSAVELGALDTDRSLISGIELALVMSHLACADDPDHELNAIQLKRFAATRPIFSDASFCLSNSGGVMLGKPFQFDMVRTGIALYGGQVRARGANPLAPVVRLDAPVVQIREIDTNDTIGYGASYRFTAPARVALLSIGYGDGLFRGLSATNAKTGGKVYFGAQAAPIVGRISMDITAVDISHIPHENVKRGSWAQIIGPRQSAFELAGDAGTIDYEVFTALGSRYERIYQGL